MNQELITITSAPARLEVNFEELKAALAAELEKYDVVVTADNVGDAKKLATELNATKKVIDDRRKEEVAKASEPVKLFDSRMKELVKLCEDGRQKLLAQVQRFEDETRARCRELLEQYRSEQWVDLGIDGRFQRAHVDDLAIVSNLTAKGALTAKAREQVRDRVKADLQAQNLYKARIEGLYRASIEKGLVAPIEEGHVAAFINEPDDATYQQKLAALLDAELRRQETAQRLERERLERELAERERAELERQKREAEAEAERQRKERELELQAIEKHREVCEGRGIEPPPPPPEPAAMEWVSVTAVFTIEVPKTASNETIANALLQKMADAGFQSRPQITVRRIG